MSGTTATIEDTAKHYAYRGLCDARDAYSNEVWRCCNEIDRIRSSAADEEIQDAAIMQIQARIEVLNSLIDGLDTSIARDHSGDAEFDAESRYEQQREAQMLGQVPTCPPAHLLDGY